jgi:anhydro-N-acetylmuramic acid kinase
MSKELFIGLMSGTSVDSIDAALIECTQQEGDQRQTVRLLSTHNEAIDAATREQILCLCQSGPAEIERMGRLDRQLGSLFARASQQLLAQAKIEPHQVSAIGCHGQTIRHRPPDQTHPEEEAFTCQIGDPNTIAELTGITTVADFRRRDIAAGGQGAPLVPRFHQAAFAREDHPRAIVNIGGMANITLLQGHHLVAGYDTGPGNVLLDAWIEKIRGVNYDRDGRWASQGSVNQRLLQSCLAHPFFQLSPPKSTGREAFNLTWLQQMVQACDANPPPEDVQATALELSAQTISHCLLHSEITPQAVYVCGGGAFNKRLMQRLSERLAPIPVNSTAQLGIAPDWVEACAFAWLARQTLRGSTGNSPLVTGAREPRILGGIFPAT